MHGVGSVTLFWLGVPHDAAVSKALGWKLIANACSDGLLLLSGQRPASSTCLPKQPPVLLARPREVSAETSAFVDIVEGSDQQNWNTGTV